MKYNPVDGYLYAYQSNYSGTVISQIDPKAARTLRTTSVNVSSLNSVQVAPTGDYLYVAGSTSSASYSASGTTIWRYHLPDFHLDAQFGLQNVYGTLAISPVDSHTYAVTTNSYLSSKGVTLYRDGTQIGSAVNPSVTALSSSNLLIFVSGSRLLEISNDEVLDLSVGSQGITWDGITHTISELGFKPQIRANLLYTDGGLEIDLDNWTIRGSFVRAFPSEAPFSLNASGDTSFYSLNSNIVSVFSTGDFRQTGKITIPNGNVQGLEDCGAETLAVSTYQGIYFVPLSSISPIEATVPAPTTISNDGVQELALPINGMAYDTDRNLVYLATPGSAGPLGNSLIVLDPLTATIQTNAYVGSDPLQIALSDSGNTIHVGLNGSRSVVTLDPHKFSIARTTPLIDSNSTTLLPPLSIAAVPGSDTAFVASRNFYSLTGIVSPFARTVAYDGGVPLPDEIYDDETQVASGNSPGTVYQWGPGSNFRQLMIDQSGIHVQQEQPYVNDVVTTYGDDLYTFSAEVYKLGDTQPRGRFDVRAYFSTLAFSPDGQTFYSAIINCSNIYFCEGYSGGLPSLPVQIQAFDRQSLKVIGQYTLRLSINDFFINNVPGLVATGNELFLNFNTRVVRVPLTALGLPAAPTCVAAQFSLSPNPSIATNPTIAFAGSVNCPYDIHSGNPSGPIVASGQAGRISARVTEVADGDTFYLQRAGIASASGTLASVTAQVRNPFIASCTVSEFSINPSPIFSSGSTGTATLKVNVGCGFDIRLNSPQGTLFSSGGAGQFSVTTGNWVTNDEVFYLQAQGDQTAAGTLATVVAKVRPISASGCTVSDFVSNPNPIRTNGTLGSTVLTGTVGCAYDIHVGSPSGAVFANGQAGTISAATGNWVTDGMMFYLQAQGDATDAGTLAVFTAKLQPAGPSSCSVHGLAANPNPIVAAAGSFGTTTVTGTSDCAFDIRIGRPDGDLFTTGGQGSFTAQTGAWVTDGMKFFVQAQGDTTAMGTLSVVVANVIPSKASSTCTASAFSVKDSPVRAVGETGTTVLTGNVNCAYDIRVGSANGALFSSGMSGAISAQTGNWVTDGMTFYLQPAGSTDPMATLGITTATLQAAAPSCVVGGFSATPITGGSNGSTTLTGTVGCNYEIHVGSPSGALLTVGNKGPVSVTIADWVSAGTTFYLQLSGSTSADGTLAVAKVAAQQ